MKNSLFLIILFIFLSGSIYSQTEESAINPDGIVFPRYTTAQRDMIAAPVQGQCLYNTDVQFIQCYSGSEWKNAVNGKIAFGAKLNNTDTLENAVDHQLQSFNEFFDYGSNFNDLTGEFQVPEDGLYIFNLKISWGKVDTDLDDAPVLVRLLVNGSVNNGQGQLLDRITLRTNYGDNTQNTYILSLSQGDIITVVAMAFTGGPTVSIITGGSASSVFSGMKVN